MIWKVLAAALLIAPVLCASEPTPKKTECELLQGVWVFESATRGKTDASAIGMVWESKVSIAGEAVRIEGLLGMKGVMKGTIKLDATTEPKGFDLKLEEFDLAEAGYPMKIPAGTYPGIYKFDRERIQIRFSGDAGGKRPADFKLGSDTIYGGKLSKAPADFKEFPKEVTLQAFGADGKPFAGAIVTTFMDLRPPAENYFTDKEGKPIPVEKMTPEQKKRLEKLSALPPGAIRDAESGWTFYDAKKTGPDGKVKLKYDECQGGSLIVRDPVGKQMGFAPVTPASALKGGITATLHPECKVIIPATCDELARSNQAGKEYFNSYLQTADGHRFAYVGNKTGKLEYFVPPGDYKVMIYGSELLGTKHTAITVPKDRSEYTAPAVAIPPTALFALLGKPAPELAEIAGWKGDAVKLADLKGQYVLLEFWGYWCGPCIGHMPALIELHEKFHGKGLTIIGIHLDADGEVTTAKGLDEKIANYKKDVWKGKDIPFPVALTSGKRVSDAEDAGRGAVAAKYGIRSYPSSILIDREGKVVGKFTERETAGAIAQIEALLKAEKK